MEQYSDPDLTHLFVMDSEMTILVITDIQKIYIYIYIQDASYRPKPAKTGSSDQIITKENFIICKCTCFVKQEL